MHDLPHLAARLYGTPLLVARAKLDVILGALVPRLAGQALSFDADAAPSTEMAVTPDGIAIVPVIGTLVARSGYLGAASGLTAYSDIAESIEIPCSASSRLEYPLSFHDAVGNDQELPGDRDQDDLGRLSCVLETVPEGLEGRIGAPGGEGAHV